MFCYNFYYQQPITSNINSLFLHDALPICHRLPSPTNDHEVSTLLLRRGFQVGGVRTGRLCNRFFPVQLRSEEHTSELQSQSNIVCRLLLEKKKINNNNQRNLIKYIIILVH